jgi:hypothetical protein
LNQFAGHTSNAEALCAEITNIINKLRQDAISPAPQDSAQAEDKQVTEKTGTTPR